jgi:hypothetical protein
MPCHTATSNVEASVIGAVMTSDGNTVVNQSGADQVLDLPRRSEKLLFCPEVYQTSSTKRGPITLDFDVKDWFPATFDYASAGTYSSNPITPVFYEVFSAAVGGANPGQITVLVEIDYECELFEPKDFASS